MKQYYLTRFFMEKMIFDAILIHGTTFHSTSESMEVGVENGIMKLLEQNGVQQQDW